MNDSKITITREMIEAARDYMPLEDKERFAADGAGKCFDRLAISFGDEELPPMYMVNDGLKRRLLMTAFAAFYMGQEVKRDERDADMMSVAAYDLWAGSHVFNQLERLKHDSAVRDKCFDLLSDFRELEKKLSAQLAGLLTVQNDAVIRQSQLTASQMKELPALLNELKTLADKRSEADGGN